MDLGLVVSQAHRAVLYVMAIYCRVDGVRMPTVSVLLVSVSVFKNVAFF